MMEQTRMEALAIIAVYLGVDKMVEQLKEGEDRELLHYFWEMDQNTNRLPQQEEFKVWGMRKDALSAFRSWELIGKIKDHLYRKVFLKEE